MATLLGYLRSVYTETPYSFSNEATRKSMELFHDTVRDNQFKPLKDEWIIFGGLTHENGDQEQTYYGRNYHGFDTDSADTNVDIKMTGAYGQFEYGFTDTLSGGILLGGNNIDTTVAFSKLDGISAYLGLYTKKDIKDLRITTGIGYQYSEYDSTRRIINNSYDKNYSDNAFNVYLDAKYSLKLSDGLYFEPKAGLSYSYIKQEEINEGNDRPLSLNVDSKDFNVLEGSIGANIKKVIMTDKGKYTLSGGVTYTRILDGYEEDTITANYGGSSFDVLIPHKIQDEISIGAKYETELENGILYNVKVNYNINMDSTENGNKNAYDKEWRVGLGFGYKFSTLKDFSLTTLFDFDK
ncbi:MULTISPECIES: autotransporter outer membrane beta-barrel domain-containing protein [Fusobacterium]|uniref:autotransporter outer membrane beta-barrel domain-containing protein n=1 Tax=Fusobacterium TaxID=848 RepID=UPI001476BECF|nr:MULTISPECIES: autotransporter outer membrane beta-barrel domain-containing protein [Fusobacterium]NME36141.1 autotransporter outer membrane beta-barrel domain-containing protein [Fusobacterium sp. FSA-380-WT-3A]